MRNVEITEVPPHVRPLIINPDPSKVLPLKLGVFLCLVVKRNLISNTWIFFVLRQSEPEQGVRVVSRGTSVRIRFGSPFSSTDVVCGHCLVTLSRTIMKH